MPFGNNTWSVYAEPTISFFNSTGVLDSPVYNDVYDAEAKYTTLDLPLGVKYYNYLNNNSKLFYSAAVVFNKQFSSSITTPERLDAYNFEIKKANINLQVGIGYVKEKYHVELNYRFKRNLLGEYLTWEANYSGFSLNFGYRIF